ncbi:MAG: hypothetical protein NVS9B15_01760 [Acidobacteriaceae bacterium]
MHAALQQFVRGLEAIITASRTVAASGTAAKAAIYHVQQTAELHVHPVPNPHPMPGMFE